MEINNVHDIIKMPEISKNVLRKMYDADKNADDFEIARKMGLIKSDKGVELLRWYYENVDGVDLSQEDLRDVVADIIDKNANEAYNILKSAFMSLRLKEFDFDTMEPRTLFLYAMLATLSKSHEAVMENATVIANVIKAISIAEKSKIEFKEIIGDMDEIVSGATFAAHIFRLTAHRFSKEALEVFYNFIVYRVELNYYDLEMSETSAFKIDSSDMFIHLLKTNTDALAFTKKIKSKIMDILESSKSVENFIEKLTSEQKLINAMLLVNGLVRPEAIINTFRCSFDSSIKNYGIELAQTYVDITDDMQKRVDDFTVLSLSDYIADSKLNEITRKLFDNEQFKRVFSFELLMNFMSISEKIE